MYSPKQFLITYVRLFCTVLYRTMGSVQSKTIFDNLRASVLHGVVQNPGQCTVPNNFDNLRASVFNDPPMFTIYGLPGP